MIKLESETSTLRLITGIRYNGLLGMKQLETSAKFPPHQMKVKNLKILLKSGSDRVVKVSPGIDVNKASTLIKFTKTVLFIYKTVV